MSRLTRRTSTFFVLIAILLFLVVGPSSAAASPGDLIVDGAQLSLDGPHTYGNVTVRNGGRIVVGPSNPLELTVNGTFLVDPSSAVIANAQAGGPGDAPVYPYGDWIAAGGGAGYGGQGGQGDGWMGGGGPGGTSYGDPSNSGAMTGSRGADGKFGGNGPGGGGGPGGRGGGRIIVIASAIQVDGRIEANGADGGTYQSGGGGGSGGGITLSANQVAVSGSVTANGGNGGPGAYGGGGGAGGRITVLYGLLRNTGTLSARGGTGGISYPSWWPKRGKGEDGQSGSALFICGDKFPPSTSATLIGVLGLNGWYTSDIQVTLSSVDCSGVAKTEYSLDGTGWNTYTAPFTISTEGTTTVYYRSTDNAGNVESAKTETVKMDKTSPPISGAPTTPPSANGWYKSDVVVHFTASDATSGLASVSGPTTLSAEGANQSVTGTATDMAGNSASFTVLGINIDKTPPTTTAAVTPPPNANGWNRTDVSVTLAATDNLSGIARTEYKLDQAGWVAYAGPLSITAEGIHTLLYRSLDRADNQEADQASTIKIDKTPPVVAISGPAVIFEGASASAVVTASDALSGLALDPSGPLPLDTSAVGPHTVTATATDKAGNSASASLTYGVWGVNGPFPPLGKSGAGTGQFKAGSTIPVKFQITSGTALITDAAGAVTIGSASTPFRWDATAQQYVANVKRGSTPGTVAVILTVVGVGSKTIATVDLR